MSGRSTASLDCLLSSSPWTSCLLCFNDMYRSSNQMRFVHFADDTAVFASDSDIIKVHATVNRALVGVDSWLKGNRLSMIVSKPYI